jgi:hypothetical protein
MGTILKSALPLHLTAVHSCRRKAHRSALVVFLATATIAMPCAAQQASSTPLPNQDCAGCFAYLEFSPSLEPQSYAMRGQAIEPATSLPAANKPSDRLGERTAGLRAASKQ